MPKDNIDRLDFNEIVRLQNILNKSVQKDIKDEAEIEIIALINEMFISGKPILIENVMIEGRNKGFNDKTLRHSLDKLKKDKIIYEPEKGFIQRV